MTVAVNMPQMAANGLSENWLFKFCGDLLWERLCRSLGTSSSALCTDSGERLYSSFVAISARYSAPLSTVKENDQLEESLGLARYGSSFFHGAARLVNDSIDLRLEMLTAFVSRSAPHGNDLRKGTPAARFAYEGPSLAEPPELLARSADMRKGLLHSLSLESVDVPVRDAPLALERPYAPSPYVDYNGANLLYYAAYPTIYDGAERLLVHEHGLLPGLERDWALATSTLARDVYYYRNLDLGEDLVVRLKRLERHGERLVTHGALLRAADRATIAEVVTVKALLD